MKVGLYREHGPCRAILVVEPERVHVAVHARDAGGWTSRIADLYRDTRWQPRRSRAQRT